VVPRDSVADVVSGAVAGSRASSVLGSNAPSTSGTSVGCVVGGGLGLVEPVNSPLTASELAVRVIPAINALKGQLAGLVNSLPVMEAAVRELRAGLQDGARKLDELSRKLTETRASVKYLNEWTIAADYDKLSRGAVGSSGHAYSLSVAPPHGVDAVAMSTAVPQVLGSTLDASLLHELLASDIDSLLD